MIVKEYVANGYGPLSPSFIAVHSTANPGAGAWNHVRYVENGAEYYAHVYVDWTGAAYQVCPYDRLCWHVGNGNGVAVGIEICEGTTAQEFRDSCKWAIVATSEMMDVLGISIANVRSHDWFRQNYGGTTHTDPNPYFERWGWSFDSFVKDLSDYRAGVGWVHDEVFGVKEEEKRMECCIVCEPNLTDSQLFRIEEAGNGLVNLRCRRGGMLDVIGGTDAGPMKDFRAVWTHGENGTPAQAFRLEESPVLGAYRLASSIDDDFVIDAVHGPVGKRGPVQMHRKQSKMVDCYAQSWFLMPWWEDSSWNLLLNAKSFYALDANPTAKAV